MSIKYKEGRLRRFLLLHYQERFPEKLNREKWVPIGVGIHVPKGAEKKSGSIDVLFVNRKARFLLAEIKREENTERGSAPICQAERYWKGLCAIKDFGSFYKQLTQKWVKKEAFRYIKQYGRNTPRSFDEAVMQLLSGAGIGIIAKAFIDRKKSGPNLLVVQNVEQKESIHDSTSNEILKRRRGGLKVQGLAVSAPHNKREPWKII